MTAYRSLGPLFVVQSKPLTHLLISYNDTGNIEGKRWKGDINVNPLFVYSSIAHNRCALHGGTTPTAGFHIASAFVDLNPPSIMTTSSDSSRPTTTQTAVLVVTYMKNQFAEWCVAFRKSSSVTIYHHCDDVVRFSYTLQTNLDPTTPNIFDYCSAPWNPPRKLEKFDVAESPYGPYDVIETSNLADDLALPILVISVLPLLKRNREATLYTTNLVVVNDMPPEQKLKSLLYCDPLAMFALLSCVPAEFVSGFCNNSSLYDATVPSDVRALGASGGAHFKWNFSWKRWMNPDLDHSVPIPSTTWETDTMVRILSGIYTAMFEQHRNVQLVPKCTQGSFFALLRFLKVHLRADWKAIIETKLPDLVGPSPNKPLVILNPDFALHCHLHQIMSPDLLDMDCDDGEILDEFQNKLFPINHPYSQNAHLFAGPFIMRVPRRRILPLVPYLKAHGDVVFRVQLFHSDVCIVTFSSIEITFGSQNRTTISPDLRGWEGSQDMFVHFYLPFTYLIAMIELKFKIGLTIQHISEEQIYRAFYGGHLIVFETDFSASTNFWPCNPRKIVPATAISPIENIATPKVGRVITGPKITQPQTGPLQMISRLKLYDAAEKDDLLKGCNVEFKSISPMAVTVKTPKWRTEVHFPYPHNNTNPRLRISRKRGWFEIIVEFETSFKLDSALFPVVRDFKVQSTVSWNLPRVVVDMLPPLNLANEISLDWIRPSLKSMCSASEIVHFSDHGPRNTVLEKSKAHMLMSSFITAWLMERSGSHEARGAGSSSIFLQNTGAALDPTGTFIFLDSIRLHSSSDGIIANAYTFTITSEILEDHLKEVKHLMQHSFPIKCEPEVFRWWTLFIQASIERSRYWTHSSQCYTNRLKAHDKVVVGANRGWLRLAEVS